MARQSNFSTVPIVTRLSTLTFDWVNAGAKKKQISRSEFLRRSLDDLATCFGMAQVHARAIETDRLALGLEWRDYLLHLLAKRVEVVQQRGPGFERADPEHLIAKAG